MTDQDTVERVARLFGRAVVPLTPREAHHKPAFATVIKGSAAVELMAAAHPHLGSRRQRQIEVAMSSWNGATRRSAASTARCAARGCKRPVEVRGLCRQHYKLWWKSIAHGRTPRASPVARAPLFAAPDAASCTPDCDVQWLAGLLEGEGAFSLNRGRALAYPVISLQMCDEDVVRRAAAILGASGVWLQKPRHPNWSPTFGTSLAGRAGVDWMVRLHGLMGDRRRHAIELALAAYSPIRLVDPPQVCVVPDCGEPHRSRGLCHKHYMAWSRDVARGREPRVMPLR